MTICDKVPSRVNFDKGHRTYPDPTRNLKSSEYDTISYQHLCLESLAKHYPSSLYSRLRAWVVEEDSLTTSTWKDSTNLRVLPIVRTQPISIPQPSIDDLRDLLIGQLKRRKDKKRSAKRIKSATVTSL